MPLADVEVVVPYEALAEELRMFTNGLPNIRIAGTLRQQFNKFDDEKGFLEREFGLQVRLRMFQPERTSLGVRTLYLYAVSKAAPKT